MITAELLRLQVDETHPLEIIVREPRKEKSHDQRKLWHAVLSDLALEVGHTPAEMKHIVKSEYYGTDIITLPRGQRFEVVKSSEEEDRAGYSRLIDFTYQFAAQNGINIQDRRQR